MHDMGDGSDYPSPRSESAGGPAAVLVSASEAGPQPPNMADPMDSLAPDFVDNARPRVSVRRTRDPPKNAVGQIFCDHIDCQLAPPTFRRPCEWK